MGDHCRSTCSFCSRMKRQDLCCCSETWLQRRRAWTAPRRPRRKVKALIFSTNPHSFTNFFPPSFALPYCYSSGLVLSVLFLQLAHVNISSCYLVYLHVCWHLHRYVETSHFNLRYFYTPFLLFLINSFLMSCFHNGAMNTMKAHYTVQYVSMFFMLLLI